MAAVARAAGASSANPPILTSRSTAVAAAAAASTRQIIASTVATDLTRAARASRPTASSIAKADNENAAVSTAVG